MERSALLAWNVSNLPGGHAVRLRVQSLVDGPLDAGDKSHAITEPAATKYADCTRGRAVLGVDMTTHLHLNVSFVPRAGDEALFHGSNLWRFLAVG